MKKYCLLLLFVAAGCAGKVARLESDYAVDLSGRWNDIDSQMVAQTLIEQAVSSGWYRSFKAKHSKKPAVIVGRVSNKTMEHINVQTFTKDLEKAMLNTGEIDIVASSEERKEVRKERDEMQEWASIESRKELANETGADFMLKGVLNSIIDEEGGKKVVYYQADLNLINVENNNIIWAGQKKLKKYIKKPLFKF
ncbi:penicillin-binding protein activator LpoB [Elusimicrobiota bacterium]